MNDWLTRSKEIFQEEVLSFLWRQWSSLGIAGLKSYPAEDRITDPEALLLFSLNICRAEPRLFDEIIDWLYANGQFVNVQRLQQIQRKYNFNCGPQLSAVAGFLSQKPGYRLKWSALAKQYTNLKNEPLFFDLKGIALPCPSPEKADQEFLKCGLLRSQIKLRGYSQMLEQQTTASLLLRLRALLGNNARAEIMALLAQGEEIYPGKVARITGYYQKTIQTTLVEMAQSDAIMVRASKKEKFYRLKPGIFDSFLRPAGTIPRWGHWASLLKAVEIVYEKLRTLSNMNIDDMLLYSELQLLMDSIEDLLGQAEVINIITTKFSGPENMADAMTNFLKHLAGVLNPR